MTNTPTPAQALGEVMALSERGTPSPWRWEYNQRSKSVEIAGGKPTFDKTVMDFARWGMSSAQPRFMATQDCFRIMHKLSDRSDWIAPIEGREHHADWCADVVHPDAALMVAAVNFIRQHGQHFAGLEREVELLRARVKMMDDFHDALANEFHACGCVMGEGPKVVNARAEEAERLALKLSSWIIRSGLDPWQIKDHACAQCAPDSDIVKAGFACAYHEAAAFLAAKG